MSKTAIEWTNNTWNPVVGCTKVSAGCKNCYALTMHNRLRNMYLADNTKAIKYKEPFGTIVCHEDSLSIPLNQKNPTVYFVNSMSDLFHENVPFEFIAKVFEVMLKCPQHRFQILTKRPERYFPFLQYLNKWFQEQNLDPVKDDFQHIILGISVESQETLEERVRYLVSPVHKIFKTFISAEPLLSSLDFRHIPVLSNSDMTFNPIAKGKIMHCVDQVIIGGESGPGARPINKEWVEKIIEQCKEYGTPVFFKQWGAYGEDGVKRTKSKNGNHINGKQYLEMPQGFELGNIT